jgi:hypothetical protein
MKLRKPITASELEDLMGPKNGMFRKSVKSRAQAMLEDLDEHDESANRGAMANQSSAMTVLTESNTPAMRQARAARGTQETLDKVIELERLHNENRSQRVADLFKKFKEESAAAIEVLAGNHDLQVEELDLDEDIRRFVNMAAAAGLSARSVELVMMRTAELRVRLQIQAEKRRDRHATIERVKREESARKATLELMLGEKECLLTTPRSLIRRTLARRLHMAMRRQLDRYSICEWGCGMWLPFGRGQIEHQLHYCTKRFMACSQGCGLKMTEESWLTPVPTERDKRRKAREEEAGKRIRKRKRKSPMGDGSPTRDLSATAFLTPFHAKQTSLYGEEVEGGTDDDDEDEEKGLRYGRGVRSITCCCCRPIP